MIARASVRKVRAAATRASLEAAARQLFTLEGYHATGTNDLVILAGVTRGALYHHFRDKEALFEGVFRAVAQDLTRATGDAVVDLAGDPWLQLLEGLQSYLRLVAASAEAQRIILIDGPVVFGWARWRDIQSEYTFNQLQGALQFVMEQGLIERQPPSPLANLILAALNDAALSIANSSDPEATRAEVGAALATLVQGVRALAVVDSGKG